MFGCTYRCQRSFPDFPDGSLLAIDHLKHWSRNQNLEVCAQNMQEMILRPQRQDPSSTCDMPSLACRCKAGNCQDIVCGRRAFHHNQGKDVEERALQLTTTHCRSSRKKNKTVGKNCNNSTNSHSNTDMKERSQEFSNRLQTIQWTYWGLASTFCKAVNILVMSPNCHEINLIPPFFFKLAAVNDRLASATTLGNVWILTSPVCSKSTQCEAEC